MEEGVFTLWSIAHFFTGIVLAFVFSVKQTRLIGIFGIFAIPFIFIPYFPVDVKIVALVVVFIAITAFVISYFYKKGRKFKNFQNIIFASFLLVLWEIFEYLTSPTTQFGAESPINKISDLIIGFTGFIIVYLYFRKQPKNKHKK